MNATDCTNAVLSFEVTSPIGNLSIQHCEVGLHSLHLVDGKVGPSESVAPLPEFADALKHAPATAAVLWLKKYFTHAQSLSAADDPMICLNGLSSFGRDVLHILRGIPAGQVTSYAQLATMAGKPRAARAVGQIMRRNPVMLIIPCHRVLAKASMGGFGGKKHLETKVWLLKHEGISMSSA